MLRIDGYDTPTCTTVNLHLSSALGTAPRGASPNWGEPWTANCSLPTPWAEWSTGQWLGGVLACAFSLELMDLVNH